jgi:hypothetical protein
MMKAVEALYPYVPQKYKNSAKHVAAFWNRLSSSQRMEPSFLIIGAQKAGTSSLFKYLMRHGGYLRPLLKDIYFFDNNYHRGIPWYLSFFPSQATSVDRSREIGGPVVTGEGATYYLLHPLAPGRVRTTFPDMKLIVLLRDPVERAMSHYFHNRRMGSESLATPLAAFEQEAERLAGEEERLAADPSYRSAAHQHLSYLARGRYAEQLQRWFAMFPREQVLIQCSERFYAETDACFREVCRFLELPERSLGFYRPEGHGKNKRDDDAARAFARAHFARPNQDLYELLGERFPWSV